VKDLEPAVSLPKLTLGEQVVDDYSTISMSLRAHPLQLLRPTLIERGMKHSDALREARNGDRFGMAGLVLIRQRPGTASGVVFVTLEDEFGIANLVVWPSVFETFRRIVMGARMMGARGTVQREGIVIHLVVEQLWDWSMDLDRIANLDGRFELRAGRGDQARSSTPDPRDGPQAGYDRDRGRPGAPGNQDRVTRLPLGRMLPLAVPTHTSCTPFASCGAVMGRAYVVCPPMHGGTTAVCRLAPTRSSTDDL
jgi:error-prone DNA polymerase